MDNNLGGSTVKEVFEVTAKTKQNKTKTHNENIGSILEITLVRLEENVGGNILFVYICI